MRAYKNILTYKKYKMFIKVVLAIVVLNSLSGCSTALNGKQVYQEDGVAVSGYDPVAYFWEHQAVTGDAKYSTVYNNVRWLFSSKANLEVFISTPEDYIPQYGGYCAYAMSKGYIVSSDPKVWSIRNKKLYLNNNQFAQKLWFQNTSDKIVAADKQWREKVNNSKK